MNDVDVYGTMSSFASSLAVERGGERLQEREEIGAAFIVVAWWSI
jgi:hypothetical protein